MHVAVERIEAGSSAAWGEGGFERDAPVVVAGSVDESALRDVWSPAALAARVGALEVFVARADSERFDYAPEGGPLYTHSALPFADALDLIASSRPPGPVYALRRAELSKLGLEGEGLPGASILAAPASEAARGLWVSSESSVTPLHYDTRNNLLTQLAGRKRVTLFPASEHARLYPLPFTGANLLSRADPEALDAAEFPDFPSALALRVEIGPGDTLYIPPFWWHHVRSLDFSVSANLFWRTRPRQWLVENSVEYLRVQYRQGKLEELLTRRTDNLSGHAPQEAARLAAAAGERGLSVASVLLAAAAVRLALHLFLGAEGDSSASHASDAAPIARLMAETGLLTTEEERRVRHWLFLGDLAAQTGRAPKASELATLVAEVSLFVMQHPRWTNAPACAPINL